MSNRMSMMGLAIVLLCSLLVHASLSAQTQKQPGRNTLVLLDDLQIKSTHSIFFRSLEEKGHSLHFFEASSPDLQLSKYGDYLYDNLVIFAPQVEEFGGSLTIDALLNFIDDGRHVLIAGDSQVSEPVRELAQECGVGFGDENTFVIDHLHYDAADEGDHTLVVLGEENIVKASIITGELAGPVIFRGTGLSLEAGNSLLRPIVSAHTTSYVYAPNKVVKDDPELKGRKVALIAALQARNNARVVVSGSLAFFSDQFFSKTVKEVTFGADGANAEVAAASGNAALATNLASWTFGDRGVLRASNVRHHLVGEVEPPRVYTVKEDVEYAVDVEEWDGAKWVPYDQTIQLEFVMLDPYHRLNLQREANSATHKVQFKVPDVYGIFTFRVEYQRPGYTNIDLRQAVTVRPLRHNQYERFILSAYPYYAAAASMMFAVPVFAVFFLYHREAK
jgi:oligosaccharyltransferase complex subunit beta